MTCGPECIHDHVRPWLRKPKPAADGNGYRALCPAHDDTEHSLSVSIGGKRSVIWHCFAGCTDAEVRHALIRDGVKARCLPRTKADAADMEERVYALLVSDLSHSHKVLRIMAVLSSGGELPRGSELERMASLCGVSRAEAYRSRPARRDNPVP